jgi:hypothetical protein
MRGKMGSTVSVLGIRYNAVERRISASTPCHDARTPNAPGHVFAPNNQPVRVIGTNIIMRMGIRGLDVSQKTNDCKLPRDQCLTKATV